MPWFIVLLVEVAVSVISYLVTPHPKQAAPTVQAEQTPQASAGMPIPVVFGEMGIDGVNVLWWGDKSTNTYQIDA